MSRRRFAALISAALIGGSPLFFTSSAEAAPPTVTKVWQRAIPSEIIESSPLGIDLGGTSEKEIVVGSHDGNVYAVQGSNGANVAGWPRQTGSKVDSSVSAANVTGDARPELFVGSGTPGTPLGSVWSFNADGSTRWTFEPRDNDFPDLPMFSTPAIGEVNNDGVPDVSGFSLGLLGWSFSQAGNVNPGWPFYQDDTVFSSPALYDIDKDGKTDYVVGGDSTAGGPVDHRGGMLRAIRGDGSLIWQYKIDEMVRSSPSIGNIDGTGEPEIVVGAGDYWVRNGGANDSKKLFAINTNGTLKWSRTLAGYTSASPTIADINGDGTLDVAIGTWGDTAAEGRVYAFDGNGNPLPGFNGLNTGGGVVLGQITTADLDSDGGQDLLIPTGAGLYGYSGKTGAQLFHLEGGQTDLKSAPLVTDIDGDNLIDIILGGRKTDASGVIIRYELGPTATFGTNGWHQFRKDDRRTGSYIPTPLAKNLCTENPDDGYWMASRDGGIFAFCTNFYGSMGAQKLNQPIVGLAPTPDGGGYWMVASDGGIFSFGNAQFRGSTGASKLNQPIVGMARTSDGGGYWLVAADGGIFAYGNAQFKGSMGGKPLNSPIVGMAPMPDGGGYYLVAADGGIFAFGNAQFKGSTGGARLNAPIVGMDTTSDGGGYFLVASDGGIFAYGNAQFKGSMGATKLNQPIVGMSRNDNGYRLVAADGGIFSFNAPFVGSTGSIKLNQPIVGMATEP